MTTVPPHKPAFQPGTLQSRDTLPLPWFYLLLPGWSSDPLKADKHLHLWPKRRDAHTGVGGRVPLYSWGWTVCFHVSPESCSGIQHLWPSVFSQILRLT